MMRSPETHVFKGGYIKFFKKEGELYYTVYAYDEAGWTVGSIKTGKVKDETHIKELLAIQDLGSVKP